MTPARAHDVATVIEVWQDVAIIASLDREINLAQAEALRRAFFRAYHLVGHEDTPRTRALHKAGMRRYRVATVCAEEVRHAIAMVKFLGGVPDPEVLQ